MNTDKPDYIEYSSDKTPYARIDLTEPLNMYNTDFKKIFFKIRCDIIKDKTLLYIFLHTNPDDPNISLPVHVLENGKIKRIRGEQIHPEDPIIQRIEEFLKQHPEAQDLL